MLTHCGKMFASYESSDEFGIGAAVLAFGALFVVKGAPHGSKTLHSSAIEDPQ